MIERSSLYYVNHPPDGEGEFEFGGWIYLLRRGFDVGYVGQTRKSPQGRLRAHLSEALRGSDSLVHRWIAEDPDSVIMEIVEEVEANSSRDIDVAERSLISALRVAGCDLRNATSGGCGYPEHTPESKAKIGAKSRGRKLSPESRAKISLARKGQKMSEAQRELHAKRLRENPPFKGRKHSPESIAKMRKAKLGKKMSPEARAKLSAALKGRIFTPEHRAALSRANLGKRQGPPTAEHRAKIAAANTGKRHTEETKAKIGAAHRGRNLSPEHIAKTRRTGAKHSEETKAKMRAAHARRKVQL